ncbi:helix-turn-helix domain-containing protein [Paenibacillus dokdonensis]|uniref:helix-turn-helix domain-containing protein n=1 Tax=Paenibacillus dokdonensis TaxID=2567944 RepID=UPI0010A779FD|nr:helix-turn-helix domain-containing protein [Paenibacillus dokdonensis]
MISRLVKFRKLNRNMTLKIILLNLIFSLLFSGILLLYSTYLNHNVKSNVDRANHDNLLYIAENVDKELAKIKQSVYSLSMDMSMIPLNNADFDSPSYIMDLRRFNLKLSELTRLLPLDVTIFVYFKDANFVTSADGTRKLSLFYENLHAESSDFSCNCLHNTDQIDSFHNYGRFITYVHRINTVGSVIAKVNKSALENSFQKYSSLLNNIIIVSTDSGEIVASNHNSAYNMAQKQIAGSQPVVVDGKPYTPIHLYLNGLNYYVLYPESSLQKDLQTANRYSLTLLIVFLMIAAGLLAANVSIYRPVKSTIANLHFANQSMIQTLDQQQMIMEQNALLRLSSGNPQDVSSDMLEALQVKYQGGVILTIFFELNDGTTSEKALEAFEHQLRENYLFCKLMYRFDSHTYIIQESNYTDFYQTLCKVLESKPFENHFVMCGISSFMANIRDMYCAVQESFHSIDQYCYDFDAPYHIAYYPNVTVTENPHVSITIEKEQELITYVLNGSQEGVHHFFAETVQTRIRKMSYGQICSLFRYLQDVLNILITSKKIGNLQTTGSSLTDLSPLRNPDIMYEKLIERFIFVTTYSFTQSKSLYEKIVEFIHQNYQQQDLSLTRIADQFSISSVYLSSYFKKHSGYNISYYIVLVRIREANLQLQHNPRITLKEVAEQVGFTSERTFTRNFKKVNGTTPGQYAKLPPDHSGMSQT